MAGQTFNPEKIMRVRIGDIRPNDYNPKDKETKEYYQVKESIKVNGLMGFIVVREKPEGETKYEIIDGEQRWRACSALEYEEILIYNEGEVADKRAKELTLWWQAQVPFNKNELAKMIHGMMEEYGEIQSYFTAKTLDSIEKLSQQNNLKQEQDNLDMTPPAPPEGDILQNLLVQVSTEQLAIIQEAESMAKVEKEGASDGDALTFIAQFFIDSHKQQEN